MEVILNNGSIIGFSEYGVEWKYIPLQRFYSDDIGNDRRGRNYNDAVIEGVEIK